MNKHFFKNYLLKSILIVSIFLFLFFFLNKIEFALYNYHNNVFINNLIYDVLKKYPEIEKKEILSLLDGSNKIEKNILKEYGINLKTDSFLLENEKIIKKSIVVNLLCIFILLSILITMYIFYLNKKNKELKSITKYLEKINSGMYMLEIDTNQEDELSILKNEIYKITVMLREQANLSKKDKLLLKTSLEDLSHQLKTPLTSISIMLENIRDGNLDIQTKKEFIKDMQREILKISFLVNTLLKLSKFDANTITFHNTKFFLDDLVGEAIKNVSMLSELKNITFSVTGRKTDQMIGDFKWQIEAITNILKNCIEYSYSNSSIFIIHDENKLYTSITIKDQGIGMDLEDLKNLFKRFYRGKSANRESVGIGLSLAKTIIEYNNGYIHVSSKKGEGTTFVIKYLK